LDCRLRYETRGFYRRELGVLRATRLIDGAIEATGPI
jgi:hypothetical protein